MKKIKLSMLFILVMYVNFASANEISSTSVFELIVKSEYVLVITKGGSGSTGRPICIIEDGGFTLQNDHLMFDEIFSILLSAKISSSLVDIVYEGELGETCKLTEISI